MGFSAVAAAGIAMQVAGTMQAADAQKQAGQAQKQASDFTAGIETQQAGQARATSQRQAIQERKKADLVQSAALARAAASGGGASDPSVVNILSDIEGKGEYNAMTALFNGEERARGLETDASLKRFEGDQALTGAGMKADATLMSGFGTILGSSGTNSLYSKYGSPVGGPGQNYG